MIRAFIIGTLVPLVLQLGLFFLRSYLLKKAQEAMINSRPAELYNKGVSIVKSLMLFVGLVFAFIFTIFGTYLIYDLFIR